MDWTRGHTLGRGSTAAVYIAESHRSGQLFAVKSAELHRSELLKREQGILSSLKCPQIVTYQGCDTTLENGVHWFNLFMEYAPHGTLAEHGGGMEEAVVGSYTRQILQGLNYLHSKGIVHCDVKGQNVLVTEKGVKIADLGCARKVGESTSAIAGTPAFMAPEVARGEEQGFPADVWALGCTVLEMITGKPPWHGGCDPAAVIYRIGFSGEVPVIPSLVSEQGKDFLGKCFKRDPNERWSVKELLGHSFVKDCKELKLLSLDSDTPTSVLERGFWDSLDPARVSLRDWSSPRDRIHRLFSDEPVWEWDDDDQWVTVRSNEVHHFEGLSLQKMNNVSNTLSYDQNDLVIFCDPKNVVVIVIELSRWNAIGHDCYVRGSNCCCHVRESKLLFWSCLMIVPIRNFDFPKKEVFIMHAFLLSVSLFNYTLVLMDGSWI
ncbi:hypothetical protein VNO77_01765 [Canavalia gladiata]|uniref:Protein kinase domain-containing protein n=1 Tax=Canavalia gladiata TaxID=3824 RepID=A0AAN9MRR5_CANGL